ncbi:2-amino-4-hydroxy-6-hydroxymethyldihydropteridine diphosphokinase [Nodosilinea sp. LEGE 06152]|uniref:2-amino-4-hydroxy-6- hydroxymethyldihydropteridine diphosphokinase n=1 Tax=Nodosilinea sp. LEGE 06152 TaxID=2777966 RepID=UPI0018821DDA|nr:2-amino-4-hydroxy-6-hydroxymethyldihydropteridine diphosphokinase [Nodosilinea sp. LEGE 06152]MBE9157129.1 2-amino-4-hydroxy-6-hydroxymethyldihydropteridine diphosphokinase [Nodosilinea sp. LEGE 06152]
MTVVPCAIALGSNLGDSWQTLRAALVALHDPPTTELVAQSSVYRTVAIGPAQPDILNACALLNTTLSPQQLLSRLLQIEQNFGRVRRQRWGPRTLDLDIIFYGQVCLTEPNLHIPHPRLRERAFVLVPLAEIAPDWCDPVSGQTVKHLCRALDPSGVTCLGAMPH